MDKKEILKKAVKAATPIARYAAGKAAPKAKQAAVNTLGVVAKAGSSAIEKHEEKKIRREQERILEFREKYPGCAFLYIKDMIREYHLWTSVSGNAFEVYDEWGFLKYALRGGLRRKLILLDSQHRKIGHVKEEGILSPSREAVYWGNNKIYDIGVGNFKFSDPGYYLQGARRKFFTVFHCGIPIMERTKMRKQELLVIPDPMRTAECLLIYAAVKLIENPKPDSGGCGGE